MYGLRLFKPEVDETRDGNKEPRFSSAIAHLITRSPVGGTVSVIIDFVDLIRFWTKKGPPLTTELREDFYSLTFCVVQLVSLTLMSQTHFSPTLNRSP